MLNKFKQEMLRVFKMSDLNSLSYYLRIEVHQTVAGITISQGADA
jgi:tRNA(Ser,Leu) C12 N-acetylase TAN1